jgi:hypothetical protein
MGASTATLAPMTRTTFVVVLLAPALAACAPETPPASLPASAPTAPGQCLFSASQLLQALTSHQMDLRRACLVAMSIRRMPPAKGSKPIRDAYPGLCSRVHKCESQPTSYVRGLEGRRPVFQSPPLSPVFRGRRPYDASSAAWSSRFRAHCRSWQSPCTGRSSPTCESRKDPRRQVGFERWPRESG